MWGERENIGSESEILKGVNLEFFVNCRGKGTNAWVQGIIY
jgi:hypothetical protein